MTEPLAQLRRLPASLRARPWQPKHYFPRSWTIIWCLLSAGFISLCVGLALSASHSSWGLVGSLTAISLFGVLLQVEVSENGHTSCAEIFYLIAFAVLPIQDAAIVALAVILLGGLRQTQSWMSVIAVSAMQALAVLAAIFVLHATGQVGTVSDPVLLAGALAAAYVAAQVAPLLTIWIMFRTAPVPVETAAEIKEEQQAFMHEGIREIPTQLAAQVPMSLLGIVAYHAAPWLVAAMVIPYMIAWRTTHQRARLATAERAAHRDPLTGLLNRAGFAERAEAELAASDSYGHELTLMIGDLDNFKKVNDTLGHLAGDNVLRSTSSAIREVMASARHTVARYGGEEFVMLVVGGLGVDDLRAEAESVRVNVEAALQLFSTSISIGVAIREPGEPIDMLIERADKAMYSAKIAGKNRVHVWPEGIDMLGDQQADSAVDAA